MPLQQAYSDSATGAVFAAAYRCVTCIALVPDAQTVSIEVKTYLNAAAKTSGLAPLRTDYYPVKPADFVTYFHPAVLTKVGHDPYSQAYLYLQTLADFAAASVV